MPSLQPFGWHANKRPRVGSLQEEVGAAFRHPEELEEEFLEEAPAPSMLKRQLEDAKAKCRRLSQEGVLLAEAERYAEALRHWEEALMFCGEPAERGRLLEQSAQVLLLLNRHFDAVRAAERAVEDRPLWHYAHLTLGRALLAFGELERGTEALRRSALLAPEDPEVAEDLREAELLWSKAKSQAEDCTSKEFVVNGRVVVPRFWETALRVTYDEQGMPTTHYPQEVAPGEQGS